jgi:DNA-binding GntR family transcriptional regulator
VYTDLDADGSATSLRRERAYAELKTKLLLGDFALNQRLGEERLASLIGVSRTPIREALARLHTEGLVVRSPDGGFCPTVPDVTVIRHLYEVRIGLELQGLRRPAAHETTHDLDRLQTVRAEWEQLASDVADEPDSSFVVLDENFHIALSEASGNPALADMLRLINDRVRMVRMQDFLQPGRVRATIDEHLSILDAVLDGDLLEAERRYLRHLDVSQAVVEQRVLAVISRMTGTVGP